MNRAFKVIFIGVSKNPERTVVTMYNNVDIISETYEDIASGKPENCKFVDLQIRWFQTAPLRFDDSKSEERFRISRNYIPRN